ncbi:MAG: hypothetical protein PHQ43_12775 [Dehalococcoidales bacterium]|nr:hypothetical protein [Dehalococcoidales bacterium]
MSTELAKIDNFAALKIATEDLKEILQENLGGQRISASELDRIKIPSGGGTTWEVPTLSGMEDTKAVTGVVIYFRNQNGYWKEAYDGQSNPPDCASNDGVVGVGDPGGECALCPLNQYGSDGKGKACKNMRTLFILREADVLPLVLTLPPTSLKDARKYFLRLASKGVPYYGVVTEITLEKDKNEGGIVYSKAQLTLKSQLSADTVKKLKAFQESLRPALEAVKIDAEARFPGEEQ